MNVARDILFADWSLALIWAQLRTAWRRLAAWWLREFRDLLPESVVSRICGHGQPVMRLHVESDGARLEIVSTRGNEAHSGFISWSDYSAAALDRHLAGAGVKRCDGILDIILPPGAFFHRSFDIPTHARERLHAIARQELEHRTPFRVDEIHVGMTIDPQQKDSRTLTIHQTIVRRDLVETALGRLELRLAEISFVAAAPMKNTAIASSISLRPTSDHKTTFTTRTIRALAAAAVVIACADTMLFWHKRESMIAAIEAQTAIEREKALAVHRLKDDIARVRSSLRYLEQRRSLPSTTDLWRETSRILPDNAWVTDWRVRNGSISTAGFSMTATELVGLFEKSPLFREASLDAPITFDALNGRERFSLVIRPHTDQRFAQR